MVLLSWGTSDVLAAEDAPSVYDGAVARAEVRVKATPNGKVNVQECVHDSTLGQEQRDAGQLLEAEATFLRCASVDCPQVVRIACTEWHSEVIAKVPSILVMVRDSRGVEVRAETIELDGRAEPRLERGLSQRLDPGPHRVRALVEGRYWTSEFVVSEGEKDRRVVLEVGAGPIERVSAQHSSSMPLLAWTLFGAGAVLIGGSAAVGLSVKLDADALARQCRGACSDTLVVPLESRLWVAEGLLIGGGVATLAGIVAVLTGGGVREGELRQSARVEVLPASDGVAVRGAW